MPDQASCKCRFKNRKEKANKIAGFLRNYGDDIPEADIKDAVKGKKLDKWQALCDCDNNSMMSIGRWEKSDWYLCTIKNLATHPDFRGRGLGKTITKELMADAFTNGCLVLAADVTVTNIPSQKIFKRLAFDKVNTFCWEKGEKPANILHYVKMPPKDGVC